MEILHRGGNGVEIGRCTSAAEAAALTGLFHAVADELGWQPGDQLEAYAGRSTYLAARVCGEMAGGLQLVRGDGTSPLPSNCVWPDTDLSSRRDVAHVVILALRRDYRGRDGLFGPLCVELWRHCASNGISEMWLEATPATLTLYRRLGWPLEIAGELRMHWGEPCYLCRMGVTDVAASLCVKARRSPATAGLVQLMGLGDEGSACTALTGVGPL